MRFAAVVGAVVAAAVAVAVVAAVAAIETGPSSSHTPYVIPSQSDVSTVSLLTVGDNVPGTDADGPGFQMVGIPDGLGAYQNSRDTFTVLMNHELRVEQGTTRDHGAIGAFVSKWTIDEDTLEVVEGEDLIKQVALAPGGVYGAPQPGVVLGRLCSGDLPQRSAFDHAKSGKGYPGRLYLNGEETGNEGRAFAHALDGTSYELPYLGKMSWENVVANPGTGDKTVVVGLDDSTPGQVYVYVGDKGRSGNPVERAGLVGGTLYGVKAVGYPVEPAMGIPSGTPFELVEIENAHLKTGAVIDSESRALGVTDFNRPEDGSWDPSRRDTFYWVTTDRPKASGGNSRLWRFDFKNARKPEKGGTIDMLLDGSEGQEMMDNMTVDDYGRVLINEDPGNNPIPARTWSYEIRSDSLVEIAVQKQAHGPEPNPAYTGYTTNDEEISGIIPADDILGKGWYLLDSQIHDTTFPSATDRQKLVEKGQLLALYYPVGDDG
jgi:Alkaline phosphatase PhoX